MGEAEFDKYAEDYRNILDAATQDASGEGGEYFARYKARYVRRLLSPNFAGKVLDFGCGIGLLAEFLIEELPRAAVHGYDPSQASVERVNPRLLSEGRFATDISSFDTDYDTVVMANVLHHIEPADRQRGLIDVTRRLKKGGRLIVFEHNPINPMTRRFVAACAFDEGVVLLPRRETLHLMSGAGLSVEKADFIVFFPRILALFRSLEPALRWCPLGAQYTVVGVKHGEQ